MSLPSISNEAWRTPRNEEGESSPKFAARPPVVDALPPGDELRVLRTKLVESQKQTASLARLLTRAKSEMKELEGSVSEWKSLAQPAKRTPVGDSAATLKRRLRGAKLECRSAKLELRELHEDHVVIKMRFAEQSTELERARTAHHEALLALQDKIGSLARDTELSRAERAEADKRHTAELEKAQIHVEGVETERSELKAALAEAKRNTAALARTHELQLQGLRDELEGSREASRTRVERIEAQNEQLVCDLEVLHNELNRMAVSSPFVGASVSPLDDAADKSSSEVAAGGQMESWVMLAGRAREDRERNAILEEMLSAAKLENKLLLGRLDEAEDHIRRSVVAAGHAGTSVIVNGTASASPSNAADPSAQHMFRSSSSHQSALLPHPPESSQHKIGGRRYGGRRGRRTGELSRLRKENAKYETALLEQGIRLERLMERSEALERIVAEHVLKHHSTPASPPRSIAAVSSKSRNHEAEERTSEGYALMVARRGIKVLAARLAAAEAKLSGPTGVAYDAQRDQLPTEQQVFSLKRMDTEKDRVIEELEAELEWYRSELEWFKDNVDFGDDDGVPTLQRVPTAQLDTTSQRAASTKSAKTSAGMPSEVQLLRKGAKVRGSDRYLNVQVLRMTEPRGFRINACDTVAPFEEFSAVVDLGYASFLMRQTPTLLAPARVTELVEALIQRLALREEEGRMQLVVVDEEIEREQAQNAADSNSGGDALLAGDVNDVVISDEEAEAFMRRRSVKRRRSSLLNPEASTAACEEVSVQEGDPEVPKPEAKKNAMFMMKITRQDTFGNMAAHRTKKKAPKAKRKRQEGPRMRDLQRMGAKVAQEADKDAENRRVLGSTTEAELAKLKAELNLHLKSDNVSRTTSSPVGLQPKPRRITTALTPSVPGRGNAKANPSSRSPSMLAPASPLNTTFAASGRQDTLGNIRNLRRPKPKAGLASLRRAKPSAAQSPLASGTTGQAMIADTKKKNSSDSEERSGSSVPSNPTVDEVAVKGELILNAALSKELQTKQLNQGSRLLMAPKNSMVDVKATTEMSATSHGVEDGSIYADALEAGATIARPGGRDRLLRVGHRIPYDEEGSALGLVMITCGASAGTLDVQAFRPLSPVVLTLTVERRVGIDSPASRAEAWELVRALRFSFVDGTVLLAPGWKTMVNAAVVSADADAAAVKLQSMVRGNATRRKTERLVVGNRPTTPPDTEETAAIKLQSVARGHAARRAAE